jgi:cytochrome c2
MLIAAASSTSSGVSNTTVLMLKVPLTLPTDDTAVVLTLSGMSAMWDTREFLSLAYGGPEREKRMRGIVLLLLIALVVTACGGGTASGSASNGEKIFNQDTIGSDAGCHTCHSVEPGVNIVGPSLAGMASDAAGDAEERGVTTEEMLRIMITDPNDEVVEGFPPYTMPQDFGTQLSEDQLNDVIAYLMTLK